jgi:hypothetical protein
MFYKIGPRKSVSGNQTRSSRCGPLPRPSSVRTNFWPEKMEDRTRAETTTREIRLAEKLCLKANKIKSETIEVEFNFNKKITRTTQVVLLALMEFHDCQSKLC